MWIIDFVGELWEILLDVALVVAGIFAAGHALIWKRHPRAALGWVVVCLAIPGFGPLFYLLFGVNRIKTRAQQYRKHWPMQASSGRLAEDLPSQYREIATVADKVTRRSLLAGNKLTPLHNGEQAYPAMLDAIRNAKRSVQVCSFIFDASKSMTEFVDAVVEAHERGVTVQVLVDGIGEFYSMPRISKVLGRRGVPAQRFLPPRFPIPRLSINLRNHRKILVVDGEVGFTGGMNIANRHLVNGPEKGHKAVDLHFKLEGPVVAQLEEAFREDWCFATGTEFKTQSVAAPPEIGDLFCRAISDGPNEDFEKLQWILLGAIRSAQKHVRIMTPYFVPDRDLISALATADLRGVDVQLILPENNNLPFVHWASRHLLWQVLEGGVEIYYQPGEFAHTKLLVIDDHYSIVGSANLDARSLRLNFEFNVEVYGKSFAEPMIAHFDEVKARSREVTLKEVDSRSLPIRLRDGFARLFAPYL